MAKKIGDLEDVIKHPLYKYILMGVFEEVMLGGENTYEEFQKDFKVKISKDINMIMLRSIGDDKFKIELARKSSIKNNDVKAMIVKHTFIIHYKEPNLPVYNSEY